MPTNLSLLNNSQIQECIDNKSLKIAVIGIDINEKLVNKVNSGDYPLKDEPEFDKVFESVLEKKKFSAETDISKVIPNSDIVLLSLPTPMNNQNIPDYTALLTVGKSLNGLLSNGQIVIVESTVEPGFIENELHESIEGSEKNLKTGIDFHLAV